MSKINSKVNTNSSKELKDKNVENSLLNNESQENKEQNDSKIKQEKQTSNEQETLKQTDLFQGSATTLLQNTSYPKEHWVVLESILHFL